MDVLSDVLRAMRLCGSVFFTAEFSSPWALESPSPHLLAGIVMPDAEHLSIFHILVDGDCVIECGAHALAIASGDVVLFPHGRAHTMRSSASVAAIRLEHVLSYPGPDAVPRVTLGGGGRRALFICGYLNCSQRFSPLFDALPEVLVARRAADYAAVEVVDATGRVPATVPCEAPTWLGTTVGFTIDEATVGRPGNGAMLGRLMEIMFVELVRGYLSHLAAHERGWLAALKDRHVGQAIRALHEQPFRQWTVGRLAREVGMSRSALARRFASLLGESPMRYLLGWRMHLAKQMLRDRAETIESIAERIGYDSEPAFNRAFKKATGRPPAAWRRLAARAAHE